MLIKLAFGGDENGIDKKAMVNISHMFVGVMNIKGCTGESWDALSATADSGGMLIIQTRAQLWETKAIS